MESTITKATLFLLLVVQAKATWQRQVDTQLIEPGLVGAAIIGLDGNTWASNNLTMGIGEGKALADMFNNHDDAYKNGIRIGSVKYLPIKVDGNSIYGKYKDCGVITAKTNQCIIIGVFNDKLLPGNAIVVVEKYADYLRENKY